VVFALLKTETRRGRRCCISQDPELKRLECNHVIGGIGVRRESGRMAQIAIKFHLSRFRFYDSLSSSYCPQIVAVGYFAYGLNWIFIVTVWFRMDSDWFHEFEFFLLFLSSILISIVDLSILIYFREFDGLILFPSIRMFCVAFVSIFFSIVDFICFICFRGLASCVLFCVVEF
jgi:hypothetical protein